MTTYITRPSGLWRRIEVASRPDCPMVRYVKVPHSEHEYTCAMSPVEVQLIEDIAAARKLWRKIVFVPGAPILRLEPDAMMSVNDSANVTVVPARAA